MAKNWLNANIVIHCLKIVVLLLIITIPFLNSNILNYLPDLCLFKRITGKECWGCGLTRAFFLIYSCKISDAIHLNWRIIIVFPILVYLYIKAILRLTVDLIQKITSIP